MSAASKEGYFETDLSSRRPVDAQIQKILTFVQTHGEQLHRVESTSSSRGRSSYAPVRLVSDPCERVSLRDTLHSGDTLASEGSDSMQRVTAILAFLSGEIQGLKTVAEGRLFPSLIMFGKAPVEQIGEDRSLSMGKGEGAGEGAGERAGGDERAIAAFLPVIFEISTFLDRCCAVARNTVQQLSSIISDKKTMIELNHPSISPRDKDKSKNKNKNENSLLNTHLFSVFKSLGDLFTIFLTFDHIILGNESLRGAWGAYKTMIKIARSDPRSFDSSESEINDFEKVLASVDLKLFKGNVFTLCMELDYEIYNENQTISVRSNDVFLTEILYCIKVTVSGFIAIINTNTELFERREIAGWYCLYLLYCRLIPQHVQPEEKVLESLWKLHKKMPSVVLCQNVVWGVGEFLQRYAPFVTTKNKVRDLEGSQRSYLADFDGSLRREASSIHSQCSAWFVLIDSKLSKSLRFESSIPQSLSVRGSLLLKGLSLASRAVHLVQTFLVLHSASQTPIGKSNLLDVSQLIELVAAIESTYVRTEGTIREYHNFTVQQAFQAIFETTQTMQQKSQLLSAVGVKFESKEYRDYVSAMKAIEKVVLSTESLSHKRQFILAVSSEVILGFVSSPLLSGSIKSSLKKDCSVLCSAVYQVTALANIHRDFKAVFDMSFLYHHLEVLSPIVRAIYQQSLSPYRLPYVIGAFMNGARLLTSINDSDATKNSSSNNSNNSSSSGSVKQKHLVSYRDFIINIIQGEVVCPLSIEIETNLRLSVFLKDTDQGQSLQPDPGQSLQPHSDFFMTLKTFLDVPSIRIVDVTFSIREEVARYLDLIFYNLVTVSISDARTYREMKILAKDKLGLRLLDNCLPLGSLEQGVDLLLIMRNIDAFVSEYNYNMNAQQFIEYRINSKTSIKNLNILSISSIIATIRQHGLGLVSASVNLAYQSLTKKFQLFSQFLFDEYLRGYLLREHRWFKKHKNDVSVNNVYPRVRSVQLVKDLRRLGMNEAGLPFLDQFRLLITEIGNALGYVRMVRSAALGYCSQSAAYLPELDPRNIVSFERCTSQGPSPLSAETIRAGRGVDEVISSVVEQYSVGNDYFEVLVDTFQAVLLTKAHEHLRTFHMIVPALCMSWIDAALRAKENMLKIGIGGSGASMREKEVYFADDGFALGVAYCLTVLKQSNKNESLHWFEAAQERLEEDRAAQIQLEVQMNERRIAKRNQEIEDEKKSSFSFRKATTFLFGSSFSTSSSSSSSGGGNYENSEASVSDEKERRREEKSRRKQHKNMTALGGEEEDEAEDRSLLQLNEQRIDAKKREIEQLFFSLNSARILFKHTDTDT